jgi:hypothetical protein
LLII